VTWSITAGALPAGLTLDTATGAITGTPTVSGTFTFTVTADDGEGHTDTHEYTLAVYNGPVIAFYPYGNHLYTSFRDAPGHWTDPHLYATTVDPTVGGAYGITCGIEGATPATNPLGVAMTGSAGYVYYGQGQPDPQYSVFEPLTGNINVDNIDYPTYTVEPLGFDHMSAGVWLYSGDYWLIAVRSKNFTSENTIVALKAVSFDGDGFPTGWHAADLGSSNEPHCDANRFVSLRWDGSSSFFDLYGPASFTTNSTPRQLYTFDFSTETWGTPYGSVDPGAPTACALPVSASGNTIFRYPNDDIGIVYHYYATSPSTTLIGEIYYRLYDRATDSWGSEMLIISRGTGDLAGISTVIPDPGSEMLHLFEYRDHQSSPTAGDHVQHGTYHIVEHDGTFHGDLFEFPVLDGPAGQYEGWGHGVEFDGSLLVPRAQHWYSGDYPDYTRPPVEVWVGPTAGTGSKTFTAEHLPLQPTAPIDGIFTMYYLARASGSYVVIPPSSFSIFPQYIKSHNRFAH
jgi:hypothetical protein